MSEVKLTKAQERGLEWLPSDGSWRLTAGKISSAVNSFRLHFPDLAEYEWGNFGPRNGRALRYRLTKSGIRFKGRRSTAGERES